MGLVAKTAFGKFAMPLRDCPTGRTGYLQRHVFCFHVNKIRGGQCYFCSKWHSAISIGPIQSEGRPIKRCVWKIWANELTLRRLVVCHRRAGLAPLRSPDAYALGPILAPETRTDQLLFFDQKGQGPLRVFEEFL
jgi:hypothetical protein